MAVVGIYLHNSIYISAAYLVNAIFRQGYLFYLWNFQVWSFTPFPLLYVLFNLGNGNDEDRIYGGILAKFRDLCGDRKSSTSSDLLKYDRGVVFHFAITQKLKTKTGLMEDC